MASLPVGKREWWDAFRGYIKGRILPATGLPVERKIALGACFVTPEYTPIEISTIRNEVRNRGASQSICPRDAAPLRFDNVIWDRTGTGEMVRASIKCPKCFARSGHVMFRRLAPR